MHHRLIKCYVLSYLTTTHIFVLYQFFCPEAEASMLIITKCLLYENLILSFRLIKRIFSITLNRLITLYNRLWAQSTRVEMINGSRPIAKSLVGD